ncbi:uncharacterized protein LOC128856025 [Anastrepha ludens]|uniref:uncharacterized protein LOC128856025 n=1 Tax=Anastrepha ludens TaxID=28586 RepID=UPI0023B087F6|nr:uncharacterized protein LOC128856025 [Anastrepha ludens]
MDHFNIPKKVNRHVLKALGVLSGGSRHQVIITSNIINQVKYQMRNLVPVPNLESAVQKSLKNLSEVGLIERLGTYRYALGRCAAVVPSPNAQPNSITPDRRVFRGTDPRRCSRSTLDPNTKRGRACTDEESLSGDDIDRTRKRMRTNNKKVRHTGRWAYLPRVRQHKHNRSTTQMSHINASIDTPLIFQDLYSLHHPHTQLQECCPSRGYQYPLGMDLDFMLANVTPTPSLEISEITSVKNIVDVRKIVETPPLQEQNEEMKGTNGRNELQENEERDLQTQDLSTSASDYKTAASSSKTTINQNQMSKSCVSRQTINTFNTVAATSRKSSISQLPDYTQSYIK